MRRLKLSDYIWSNKRTRCDYSGALNFYDLWFRVPHIVKNLIISHNGLVLDYNMGKKLRLYLDTSVREEELTV